MSLRDILDAATPGPWEARGVQVGAGDVPITTLLGRAVEPRLSDARLIALVDGQPGEAES